MQKQLMKNEDLRKKILDYQKSEITEYHIYNRLAKRTKDRKNREVLERIAGEEKEHHDIWKNYTGSEVRPSRWKILFYYWISVLLGLTFGIKLMEKGEEEAQEIYSSIPEDIPELERIIQEEDRHEQELINLIEEEHLQYVGSMVLGLNDALVELTGTLAGLSFALKETRLIALAGLVTGIAASFSMAASEYLASKTEGEQKKALKSSLYTGGAYIITVAFLILPYLLLKSYLLSLGLTIIIAILIIFIFNFYISVARDLDFKKRFLEMAAISLGVALISFVVGYIIRIFLGVDV